MAHNCYLCGSQKASQLSERLRGGLENEFLQRPYRCDDCQLVFLAPLMSIEAEQGFYTREYRRIYHGDDYDLEKFHRERQTDSDRRMRDLERAGLLRGRVLDVGCSTGNFLSTIQSQVESIRGVELDAEHRKFASEKSKLELAESIDGLRSDEHFDLITLFHVLEHMRNPVEFLRELAKRLAPNGAMVVEVPNVEDALLSRYQTEEFATFYWHPAHSYYFSAETLRAVATRAKLQTEIIGRQRYSLANHLSWLCQRQPGSGGIDTGFLTPETEQSFAADLCRSFTCDTLWMVARPL